MEFCPVCGMLLQIDPGTGSHRLRLFCPVCPYVCSILNKVHRPIPLQRCNLFCLIALCRSVAPNRSESDAVPLCFVVPQIVKKARLVKKEVEPISSTADEMKSAPKTAGELSALLFVTWSTLLCSVLRSMMRFFAKAIALLLLIAFHCSPLSNVVITSGLEVLSLESKRLYQISHQSIF
jgi:hypothetical protein